MIFLSPTHTAIQARDSEEQDELVPCPGSILRAVARILIERCLLVFSSREKKEEHVAGEKEILRAQLNLRREESCSNELLSLKKNLSQL